MDNYTKREARGALGAVTDAEMARMIGMTKSRLSMLDEDGPVTDGVQWRIRAVLAERKLAANGGPPRVA